MCYTQRAARRAQNNLLSVTPFFYPRYTGGGRTFLSRPDAQEFRGLVYRHYGEMRAAVIGIVFCVKIVMCVYVCVRVCVCVCVAWCIAIMVWPGVSSLW